MRCNLPRDQRGQAIPIREHILAGRLRKLFGTKDRIDLSPQAIEFEPANDPPVHLWHQPLRASAYTASDDLERPPEPPNLEILRAQNT